MLKKIKSAKNIHVVGVSGTEGAAVALFLKKLKVDFTAHDFSEESKFERNFKANHLGYPATKREKILKKLFQIESQIHFKNSYLKSIENADLVFVSQNWEAYSSNQKLEKIFARNSAKFATITQLYFQLFPGKIIAVTGTNGKSTTTKLIAEIMHAADKKLCRVDTSRQSILSSGHRVDKNFVQWTPSRQKTLSSRQAVDKKLCRVDKTSRQTWFTGNDRRNIQILDCLDKWTKNDWLTIEVSNRQLKFPLGRAPDIGVILNVSPNHLNEYGNSFSAYKKGKFSLIAKQNKTQTAVLNHDNLSTRQFLEKTKATPLPYSTDRKLSTGVYIDDNWIVDKNKSVQWTSSRQKPLSSRQAVDKKKCPVDKIICRSGSKQRVDNQICPLDKICLLGKHNLSNILAAVAATLTAGVSKKIICDVVSRFRGIPQRLELVSKKGSVKFVNDSASTTPESTIAALRSFPKNSINLIAGGDTKGMNYTTLAREIQTRKVRITLLESPLASILKKLLKKEKVSFEIVKTLQEAVKISAKNASLSAKVLSEAERVTRVGAKTEKGNVVLLSPAAAWFCYFAEKIPLGGRGFEKFVKTLV